MHDFSDYFAHADTCARGVPIFFSKVEPSLILYHVGTITIYCHKIFSYFTEHEIEATVVSSYKIQD